MKTQEIKMSTTTTGFYGNSCIIPQMTKEEIKKSALEHGGYECPDLNDSLYLHYKGYERIENLEEYIDLKTIWLDSNGFNKIENISHLTQLRCLFLQKNLFSTIENLENLNNLVQLDLSENRISVISGISHLPNLTTLNLAKNALIDGDSIEHLQQCMKLSSVDLSKNHLTGDNVIEVLSKAKGLIALNMVGNPVVTETSNFQKRCISAMTKLRYLDRPIFDIDRVSAEAWGVGGVEAEIKAKTDWKEKEQGQNRRNLEDFRSWQASIRAKKQKELLDIEINGLSQDQMNEKEKRELKKKERLEAAKQEAEEEKNMYAISSLLLSSDSSQMRNESNTDESKNNKQENNTKLLLEDDQNNIEFKNHSSPVHNTNIPEMNHSSLNEELDVNYEKTTQSSQHGKGFVVVKSMHEDREEETISSTTTSTSIQIVPQKEEEEHCAHKKLEISSNNNENFNIDINNSNGSLKGYHDCKKSQDIVQESLEIYYRNKKEKENNRISNISSTSSFIQEVYNKSDNYDSTNVNKKEIIIEEKMHIPTKEYDNAIIAQPPSDSTAAPTNTWTEEMDNQLSMFVKEYMYDFDSIAIQMNKATVRTQKYTVTKTDDNHDDHFINDLYTATSCRLRWCQIDDITQQQKQDEQNQSNNSKVVVLTEHNLKNVQQPDTPKKICCTIEELTNFAYLKPSAYIHPPKILPSSLTEDDDYDDDIDYYDNNAFPLSSSSSEDWKYLVDRIHQVSSKI